MLGAEPPPEPPPRFCAGVEEFAGRYDAFAIDQWGVLHDGDQPFPGAVECLRCLVELGKRVVILTNSGKRAGPNARRLRRLGFPDGLYSAVVSSGELVWSRLHRRSDPSFRGLGRRCRLLSRGGDRSVVEGLDLELADEVDDAEFVLLAGMDDEAGVEDYAPILAAARRRGLPLVCANPDRRRFVGGDWSPGCGALAAEYERAGGLVIAIGKPRPEIYAEVRRVAGAIPAHRIVAIGDSLPHDVAGAARAGFATALVTGGVHRKRIWSAAGASRERVVELAREEGVMPDWVLERLHWSAERAPGS